jgi:pimeloyl-ACP methyl ester carboxylesterase
MLATRSFAPSLHGGAPISKRLGAFLPGDSAVTVRRRFLDLEGRQIHYREREGAAATLVALHHLPGSAAQLAPLLRALEGRRVLAPDLAGLGDSDPHPSAAPTIGDFAEDVATVIARCADGPVDVYGSHTGACVALALAAARPALVRRLVLDGLPLWSAGQRAELAARYAPQVAPDLNGAHLLWAHNFCRDQILFWPWYDKSAAAARGTGLPPARDLHRWVLEVIKALDTFPLGYRAVFDFDVAAILPAIVQPVLCIAATADPLGDATARAAASLGDARIARIDGGGSMAPPAAVAAAIAAFLDG